MDATDVVTVVKTVAGAGVTCWLDGGWAVDAVVGRQTRVHEDLDLVIAREDVEAAMNALQTIGYAMDEDLRPCSFTMCAVGRRKVDIHPVTWAPDGGGVQAQPNQTTWTYPARGFAGMGTVDSQSVRCLTAEVQILCHGGYELDDIDRKDLQQLTAVLNRDRARPIPPEVIGGTLA